MLIGLDCFIMNSPFMLCHQDVVFLSLFLGLYLLVE